MTQFTTILVGIFGEFKTMILTLFSSAAAVRIGYLGLKYKGADESERSEVKRSIRDSVIWMFALPFAIWVALYVYGKFKGMI